MKKTARKSGVTAARQATTTLLKRCGVKANKGEVPNDDLLDRLEDKAGFEFSSEFRSFLKAGGAQVDSTYLHLLRLERRIARNHDEERMGSETFDTPMDQLCFCYDDGAYICLTKAGGVVMHSASFKPRRWRTVCSWISKDLANNLIPSETATQKTTKPKTAAKPKGGAQAARQGIFSLLTKCGVEVDRDELPDDELLDWHENKAGFKFSSEFRAFLKAGGGQIDSKYTFYGLGGWWPEIVSKNKWVRRTFDSPDGELCFCYDDGAYICLTKSGSVVMRSAMFKPERWRSICDWMRRDLAKKLNV